MGSSVLGIVSTLLFLGDKSTNNLLLTTAGIFGVLVAVWIPTVSSRNRLIVLLFWGFFFTVILLSHWFTWQSTFQRVSYLILLGVTTSAVFMLAASMNSLTPGISDRAAQSLVQTSGVALLAYISWLCFCSVTSPLAENALRLLVKEQLIYGLWFYAVFVSSVLTRERLLVAARAASWIIAGAVLAMIGVVSLYVGGLLPARFCSLDGWIRINPLDATDSWRLQFPFQHHNRAGFFGMCAAFVLPAVFLAHTPPKRWLAALSATASFLVAVFSGTRGAVLACLIGWAATSVSLAPERRKIFYGLSAVATALFAGFLVASAPQRSHWEELLWPSRLVQGQTTTNSRLVIQSVALNLVAARPLTGWGYGYSTFENRARQLYPHLAQQIEGMSHPHNHWLEVATAGGLPGATLFFLFTFARLGALARALKQAARHMMGAKWTSLLAVWLGLELAIQFYGLTNTCLRRNLGLWTYILWAITLVLVRETDRRLASHSPTLSHHPE